MSVTGERDGEPTKAGVALLDVITGLYAAIGILAALHERDAHRAGTARERVAVRRERRRHGEPGRQPPDRRRGAGADGDRAPQHRSVPGVPRDRPAVHPGRRATTGCSPGRARSSTPGVGRRSRGSSRTRRGCVHRDELIPLLADVVRAATAREWLDALEDAAVPCAPIRAMDEVFASPEGAALIEQVADPVRGTLRLVATRSGSTAWRRRRGRRRRRSANTRGGPTRARGGTERDGGRSVARAAGGVGDPRGRSSRPPPSPRGASRPSASAGGARRRPIPTPTPTTRRALEALPEGGSVLDVGVGGGATSLPLAGRAGSHRRGR